jgi:hypothetical protein
MAEEFIIKSPDIEDKINQLLPSQGGFGAGVDFSASTMVIPIVDLTETAEGSNVRQDLQTALSLNDVTAFEVSNATTTVINTTGYFRIFGAASLTANNGVNISLTDGTTTKLIYQFIEEGNVNFDFVVFIAAGQSVTIGAGASCFMTGCSKQIADLAGNLTTPS